MQPPQQSAANAPPAAFEQRMRETELWELGQCRVADRLYRIGLGCPVRALLRLETLTSRSARIRFPEARLRQRRNGRLWPTGRPTRLIEETPFQCCASLDNGVIE